MDLRTQGEWNAPNSFSSTPWGPAQWTWRASQDKTGQALGPIASYAWNQANDYDWHFMRWFLGPFDAAAIDTLFDLCFLNNVQFSNGAFGFENTADARYKLHIYVTVGESAEVRETLLDNYVDGTSLFQNSLRRWQALTTPQQLTGTLLDGDGIMIEFGFRVVSSPPTEPATYPPSHYTRVQSRNSGCAAATQDAFPGSLSDGFCPWIQFTQTFFQKPPTASPANDTCAAAIPITLAPNTPWASTPIDTSGAVGTQREVFYSWTAPADGRVYFSTFGSTYAVTLNAFINGCTQTQQPSSFVLANSRFSTSRSQGIYNFVAEMGQTYLIRVRSQTFNTCAPNSGGHLQLQGYYQRDLDVDDLLLPAGHLMVFRGDQPVSTSVAFSNSVPSGIALDYTQRPLNPIGGGGPNTEIRALLALFSFNVVEILNIPEFGSGDEEMDFIPLGGEGPGQLHITQAGIMTAGLFGNGFLFTSGQGTSLVSYLNTISDDPNLSAFQTISAVDGDNQPGNPFTPTAQIAPPEITSPWALTIDEVNNIAYYTSGSFYVPVGGQQIRRFDLTSGTYLGVWSTLPARPSHVPTVRGLQYVGNGQVLACNGDVVHLLDGTGSIVQTYAPSLPLESQQLVDVKLTADGTAFWVVDLNTVRLFKFDIATGTELLTFPTWLTPGSLVQMAIFQPGGFVPPEPPPGEGCPTVMPVGPGGGQGCPVSM